MIGILDESALKLIYLALGNISKTWTILIQRREKSQLISPRINVSQKAHSKLSEITQLGF